MKRIILITLSLICLKSMAQTGDPLRSKLDSVFQNIDKTQIPAGYLAEYGTEFTPLHWYNGAITDSNIVFNLDIFKMIYADVQIAKILPSAPSLPESELTDNLLDSLQKFGLTTSVAVLIGSYASLKPTAITENLLSYDNRRQQFNDVPGRATIPYIQKTVFAVSPIQQKFYNTVTLHYNAAYFYSNTNASLQNLAIDFFSAVGANTLFNPSSLFLRLASRPAVLEIIKI